MSELTKAYDAMMAAFEDETPKIMGMAEVADRLGWKRQQVVNYLNRAKEKGFPAGMFPKPFQQISAGWLWLASDIEKYAIMRGELPE